MSAIHSHARTYRRAANPAAAGRCTWRWEWEDVALDCDDTTIPGEHLCAEHLIEANTPRRFPARVITPPTPEGPTT